MIDIISKNHPILLMLDYDGTLTPIVSNIEEARVTDEQQRFLARIARLPSVQLALVSGRSVEQLLDFLPFLKDEPVYLVGLHGGELYDLKTGSVLLEPSREYINGIVALKTYLHQHHVDALPGIQIEDKGMSLGVHYRQASESAADIAVGHLKDGFEKQGLFMDFILRPGKKLLEAVPRGFNKGVGVEELLKLVEPRFKEAPRLIYVGDDITDFDAFKVVNHRQGVSIYVGEQLPATAPEVTETVPDVEAVYAVLEELFQLRVGQTV